MGERKTFEINGLSWEICEVDNDSDKLKISENDLRFGVCNYHDCAIYLAKDVKQEMKRRILQHELCHAYITSVGVYCGGNKYNEEQVCEIVSGCADIIFGITERYFK